MPLFDGKIEFLFFIFTGIYVKGLCKKSFAAFGGRISI
jgi:hypothetical protein